MYGWRARLGRINPSPETVGDQEWHAMSPRGVICVSTRMFIERVDRDGLTTMVQDVERAAKELASARASVILMAGTAGAFNGGPGFDRTLAERIRKMTGIAATTSMTAVLASLRALDIKRLAVATPYLAEVDDMLAGVLRAEGCDVASIRGMGIAKSIDMGDLAVEHTYRFAREVFAAAPDCDGYLISCGNLRTLEAIAPLEADLGKPIVTSNQAGFWHAMRLAGLQLPSPFPAGRLLAAELK